MNPCPRYEEALILYSYQEIGRRKSVFLQRHLSQCERCKSYLNGLEEVAHIISRQYEPHLHLDIEDL